MQYRARRTPRLRKGAPARDLLAISRI